MKWNTLTALTIPIALLSACNTFQPGREIASSPTVLAEPAAGSRGEAGDSGAVWQAMIDSVYEESATLGCMTEYSLPPKALLFDDHLIWAETLRAERQFTWILDDRGEWQALFFGETENSVECGKTRRIEDCLSDQAVQVQLLESELKLERTVARYLAGYGLLFYDGDREYILIQEDWTNRIDDYGIIGNTDVYGSEELEQVEEWTLSAGRLYKKSDLCAIFFQTTLKFAQARGRFRDDIPQLEALLTKNGSCDTAADSVPAWDTLLAGMYLPSPFTEYDIVLPQSEGGYTRVDQYPYSEGQTSVELKLPETIFRIASEDNGLRHDAVFDRTMILPVYSTGVDSDLDIRLFQQIQKGEARLSERLKLEGYATFLYGEAINHSAYLAYLIPEDNDAPTIRLHMDGYKNYASLLRTDEMVQQMEETGMEPTTTECAFVNMGQFGLAILFYDDNSEYLLFPDNLMNVQSDFAEKPINRYQSFLNC